MNSDLIFYNENDEIINHTVFEADEQKLANKYIKNHHVVLELGARYGTVSYTINKNMAKTKTNKNNNKKNFLRTVKTNTKKVLPVVSSGLKNIGSNVKNIAVKSKPGIEKGLGTVYNSILTGVNLSIKGIKSGIQVVKKSRKQKRTRRRNK
jgi:hypothetical protein